MSTINVEEMKPQYQFATVYFLQTTLHSEMFEMFETILNQSPSLLGTGKFTG